MWLCEGSTLDWTAIGSLATAIAVFITLGLWAYDKSQRRGERGASAKLLAQIMTTPVGAAQMEIAKLRCTVVPTSGDQSYLISLLNSEETRRDFASKASLLTFDLPSQYLDRPDLFSEPTNNRLAYALSQVNRLKTLSGLLGGLSESTPEKDIHDHAMAVLKQIQEAESAITAAFQVLLRVGKSAV
ncbi:hypothetical protein A9G05_16535 [Pseudomonas sp. ENNP23]|nr:hypothetical protein A9G05_16535 [Pseudomonas sp. ENNP23]